MITSVTSARDPTDILRSQRFPNYKRRRRRHLASSRPDVIAGKINERRGFILLTPALPLRREVNRFPFSAPHMYLISVIPVDCRRFILRS